LWLSLVVPAMSQPILKIDWNELAQKHELLGGQIISTSVSTGEVSTLKIENTNDTPLQLQLFEISKPAISNLTYGFIGQVKYENVRGDGYLEMWNYFPSSGSSSSETKFFSRTLGESGAAGKITGTSNWRMFSLPFNANGASKPPSRLEVNIFLPSRGTVYLRYLTLCQYNVGGSFPVASNSWWSGRTSGLIGGIGGSIIGCFGALIGCLVGMGKARRFVLAMTKLFIGLGILLTIAGLIAVALKQPYAVWYPLLLLGVILTSVLSMNLRGIKRRYEDLEIRRMASIDAMGS
ncbi:MAG: hypothetical protein ACREFE_01010, partial [Limisphaerales bacterium]